MIGPRVLPYVFTTTNAAIDLGRDASGLLKRLLGKGFSQRQPTLYTPVTRGEADSMRSLGTQVAQEALPRCTCGHDAV